MAKLPSQFNRAFDLSSLKAPAPVAAGAVIEANERIFIETLMPLSKQKPVIVVLWTPRSNESVALVEALTSLSKENDKNGSDHSSKAGRWQLATVNADTEPEIVEALRATGVPMTIALIGGQVAPLFEGLIPLEQLTELLSKVVELAVKQGVGVGAAGHVDASDSAEYEEPEITAAYGALAVNDLKRARAEFEKLLARKPSDKDAVQGVANIELLARITGHDSSEVMKRAEIVTTSDSDYISILKLAADFQFLAGDVSGALGELINLIKLTSGDEREAIRLQVLSLFAMLENDDPALTKARSELARALF